VTWIALKSGTDFECREERFRDYIVSSVGADACSDVSMYGGMMARYQSLERHRLVERTTQQLGVGLALSIGVLDRRIGFGRVLHYSILSIWPDAVPDPSGARPLWGVIVA
jgi:hypothetical protein